MSENHKFPVSSDTGAETVSNTAAKRPRIWPAVVILLAYVGVGYGYARLGSTNVQSFVEVAVVPSVAALLLAIWWLTASRTPVLDRLLGFALFAAAQVAVVYSQKTNGAMLLAYALPAMASGVVVLLVATYPCRWATRRWILAGFLVAATGLFAAMRVDTIGGNLAPIVSWRWSATAEERSKDLPLAEAQGVAAVPAKEGAGDWPGFRGAVRDGRLTGVVFDTDWTRSPKELWRIKVGPAWSSFAAVGDYIFTQEQRGGEELVTCYDAATGKSVWVNRVTAKYEDTMGLGPRATPTFADGRLYSQGATGILQCLDASTGKPVWSRDLSKDAETRVPGYGFSSSPLVLGERVIEFSGGGEGKNAVAYDRASGEVVWRGGHGATVYSSPQLVVLNETPQLLMACNFGIQALNPETGASLWDFPSKVKEYPRCVQPLVADGSSVMVGATGVAASFLLRVQKTADTWSVKEEWANKTFRPYFNDGVQHKGFCYGYDGDRLVCIDLKTGERRWDGKRYGGQLVLAQDMDMLLVLAEKGDVVLVKAVPDQFQEIARFKAISGKTWNHPVVAHGRLFVRNSEEAACFELREVAK